jgi:hypothetical protein
MPTDGRPSRVRELSFVRPQNANLLKGISRNPETRAKQIAALRPGGHFTHGAKSEPLIRKRRAELVTELEAEFPNESRRVLLAQAHRLAVAEAGMAHADEHGIVKDKRSGETFPVALLVEKTLSAFLYEEARIRAREAERQTDSGPTLEEITAEYANDNGAAP